MLIDKLNQFSDAQAITVDAISANVIDLLPVAGALNAGATGGPTANAIRDIGAGQPLYLHILVTTTLLASGGAATLTTSLESDSTADLNTSATVHWTSAAIAKATLVAGYWIAKGIAIPADAYERYLGIRYNATTNDFTSGNISAWLSTNRYDDRTYQSGFLTGVQ